MTETKSTTYFSLKARKGMQIIDGVSKKMMRWHNNWCWIRGPGIPPVNPPWRRKKVRWVERDDLSEAEETLMRELVSRRDAGYFWSVQKDPSLAHLQVARIDAPYRSPVRVMAPAAMELDSDLDDDEVSIGSQSPYGADPISNWTISHEPSGLGGTHIVIGSLPSIQYVKVASLFSHLLLTSYIFHNCCRNGLTEETQV
ncbi:hypothetical protein Dimus_039653 [Dionaea muscipula]